MENSVLLNRNVSQLVYIHSYPWHVIIIKLLSYADGTRYRSKRKFSVNCLLNVHLKPLFRLEEGMLRENFASTRSLLHFYLVNRELSDLERDKDDGYANRLSHSQNKEGSQ